MSMQNLIDAFVLIEENSDQADFLGERSDDLIKKAEQVLGLQLPKTYKAFVKKFGAGDIAGHEFYGVIHENFYNSGVPDAVWLTLHDRQEYNLPKNFIIVYQTSDNFYYVLDCSKMNNEQECAVFEWNPNVSSNNEEFKKIAEDYGEFLFNTIKVSL